MGIHSNKLSAQIIAKKLIEYNISDIVISPGSRNAPLIIEFTNQKFFNNISVIDERSAGFFGLGIAQQKQKPVALICTSGSALLNYYPAIAEAFYSRIPLIVISADRPQKWIDQGEGQTIRQDKIFINHSLYNFTFDENNNVLNEQKCDKAIKTCIEKKSPVHINIPFDEPLYDTVKINKNEAKPIQFSINTPEINNDTLQELFKIWQKSNKIMILAGQLSPTDFIEKQLVKLSNFSNLIVLNENISNIVHDKFINNIDQNIFYANENELEQLKPDLLITIGRNIISKKIKQFLRNHKPANHWHIEQNPFTAPDTFEALTAHIDTTPEMFFSQLLFLIYDLNTSKGNYRQKWLALKDKHKKKHKEYLEKIEFSDLKVFEFLSDNIPENMMLQWGNSSTVRYAQLFDFKKNIKHFANRGTSGIDGSTSTAIGACYATKIPTLMVSGDISFLYDSNSLWNKHIPNNFKIIVINNGGGDIFNFIPGPTKTKAIDAFFVTKHKLKVKKLAEMYGLEYSLISNLTELKESFNNFINDNSNPKIMEIDTSKIDNAKILKNYFLYLFSD